MGGTISNDPFFRAEKDHMGLDLFDCRYHSWTDVPEFGKNRKSEPKRDRLASEPEFCSTDAVWHAHMIHSWNWPDDILVVAERSWRDRRMDA